MSTKVLFIGIDALDSELIRKFAPDLPNISRLRREGQALPVEPIHPPDSDTAWATITTGLDPSEHGIIKYDDPLEKSTRLSSGDPSNSAIRGRTFWDAASRTGKRVCVLFPHLGYPVWPVNGIMIGRSGFHKQPGVYPEGMQFPAWDLTKLNVVGGMPDRARDKYIRDNSELLENQTRFALDLLGRERWDLFFLYSSVLDMIQHYFWNLCDPEDPDWPGPNPYADVIRDFYRRQDVIVGRLVERAGPDAAIFVVSDHGHGMRPMKIFNLNEFLRRCGWLKLSEGLVHRGTAGVIERTKAAVMKFVSSHGLGTAAARVLRMFPFLRRVFTRPLSIDWARTQAYTTNLSGLKAYSYGGIVIPIIRADPIGYEALREDIITALKGVRAEDGTPVFRYVQRREEVYHGKFNQKYPDIIFELKYGLGIGLVPGGELFGSSLSRQLVPGSHRGDTASFIRYPSSHQVTPIRIRPTMVYHEVLASLDVGIGETFRVEQPGDKVNDGRVE